MAANIQGMANAMICVTTVTCPIITTATGSIALYTFQSTAIRGGRPRADMMGLARVTMAITIKDRGRMGAMDLTRAAMAITIQNREGTDIGNLIRMAIDGSGMATTHRGKVYPAEKTVDIQGKAVERTTLRLIPAAPEPPQEGGPARVAERENQVQALLRRAAAAASVPIHARREELPPRSVRPLHLHLQPSILAVDRFKRQSYDKARLHRHHTQVAAVMQAPDTATDLTFVQEPRLIEPGGVPFYQDAERVVFISHSL